MPAVRICWLGLRVVVCFESAHLWGTTQWFPAVVLQQGRCIALACVTWEHQGCASLVARSRVRLKRSLLVLCAAGAHTGGCRSWPVMHCHALRRQLSVACSTECTGQHSWLETCGRSSMVCCGLIKQGQVQNRLVSAGPARVLSRLWACCVHFALVQCWRARQLQ